MDMKKYKNDILIYITYTVLLIFALYNISHIFNFLGFVFKLFYPFILGAIIAFVINVLLNLVENKIFKRLKFYEKLKKIIRPLSIMTTLLIIIGIIGLVVILIVPQLKDTVNIFSENMPVYIETLEERLDSFGISESYISEYIEKLNTFKDEIINYVKGNSSEIFKVTIGFASNFISSIANIVIALVFAIYILASKEKLSCQVKKIIKAYSNPKFERRFLDICDLSNKTFSNFISGQCLEALIIGLLCFIGMLILGIPYSAPISVLVGFTALIPVFGAFIGTFIGAFLIFMINPIKALIFIIFIIVLQQLEGNLIYPKVVGKQVGLPSIWVMVAVSIGASINGIIGMLLSVPICSILYSILATDVNNRIKSK